MQIDANFVGPKVVGGSTGLSAFWVIFSIMVFGGFFGLGGMIIGVPLFALIYSLAAEVAKNRLTQRDMPVSTAVYESIDHITPDEKVIYCLAAEFPKMVHQNHRWKKKQKNRNMLSYLFGLQAGEHIFLKNKVL